MTIFGVTPTGFVPKLIGDVESDIEAGMRANVDPNINLSATMPLGQMTSSVANEAAQLWELGGTLYSGLNPNNAEGIVLDGVCAYTGTKRIGPKYSRVVGAMGLNAGASVAAGSLANVSGQPNNTWTLLGPASPSTGLLLAEGPVVAVLAGTYYGLFQATTPGPTLANAGTLTVITSSVAGWNTVTNGSASSLGSLKESDSHLNVRRESELAASGGSTVDAMRADLLNETLVPGIIQAFVSENTGDVIDANGLLPHSVYVVVYDGITPGATNAAIAAVIWKDKGSGVQTLGSISVATPDSQGTLRTVNFDRAAVIQYYASLTVKTDSTFDTINGPAAVIGALLLQSKKAQNLGLPVVALSLRASALTVQGVTDVPVFTLGLAPSPTGTANLPMSGTQIATFAPGTPIVVTVT